MVEDSNSIINSASQCSILLWYCVVMIMAMFILVYYFYVVCDFVSQVYFYADNGSYEENAIASNIADSDERYNIEYPRPENPAAADVILPSYLYQEGEEKKEGEKVSRMSVGSAPKISISSSTSKLKSSNKGRKSVHVIEVVEREPDPLYSQSEEPSSSKTGERSTFDSIASLNDVETSSPKDDTTVSVQSTRRGIKPYSHHSQRKNVSFVDDTKSASSIENR